MLLNESVYLAIREIAQLGQSQRLACGLELQTQWDLLFQKVLFEFVYRISNLGFPEVGPSVPIDADLTITRNPDGAAFQNCAFANVVGESPVELGCNRIAPRGGGCCSFSFKRKVKSKNRRV